MLTEKFSGIVSGPDGSRKNARLAGNRLDILRVTQGDTEQAERIIKSRRDQRLSLTPKEILTLVAMSGSFVGLCGGAVELIRLLHH